MTLTIAAVAVLVAPMVWAQDMLRKVVYEWLGVEETHDADLEGDTSSFPERVYKFAYFTMGTVVQVGVATVYGLYPADVPYGNALGPHTHVPPAFTVFVYSSALAYHGRSAWKWRTTLTQGHEWTIHHVVTVFLLVSSLLHPPLHRLALYVILLHDVVDVVVYITKTMVALYGDTTPVVGCALLLVAMTAYLRVWTLGKIFGDVTLRWMHGRDVGAPNWPRFTSDLSVANIGSAIVVASGMLWCVHVCWLYKMTRLTAIPMVRIVSAWWKPETVRRKMARAKTPSALSTLVEEE
jgi:hypothetical protein